LDKLRKDIGDLAQSEEDVLTFAMFPDVAREYLQQRADGNLMAEPLLPATPKDRAISPSVATEFKVDVHGETYDVAIMGVGEMGGGKRKLYVSLDGMPEEVTFETMGEYTNDKSSSGRKKATEPGHVTSPLPGNVVEVLVQKGDAVKEGQAVIAMEAMKMETELLANITGVVQDVYIAKGDRVTPGEILIEIK
jgi:pyruvate carboxylase subunit B